LLVYLTQVLQAEAMRIGVEHWRRNRDRCSGTLYWQLNDCWPVASWSSIDYYGRWKALHYVSRRFYAPVLLSVEDDDTRMGIFITNDMPEVWQGEVHWSLQTVNGAVIESGYALVVAAPLATTSIQTLDFAAKIELGNRRDLVCVCELWQDDLRMTLTVTPFVPDKHLRLEEPKIETQIAMVEQRLVVQLHAESLARLVELSLDGADVIFSDNYFDLPAHEVVRVTCPLPKSWTIDLARQFLRVRSLFESY
jgi:beta-mannosidase